MKRKVGCICLICAVMVMMNVSMVFAQGIAQSDVSEPVSEILTEEDSNIDTNINDNEADLENESSDVKSDGEDKAESDVSRAVSPVRNRVLINRNVLRPYYIDPQTNRLMHSEKYQRSESYAQTVSDYISFDLEDRDKMVEDLAADGKIFANKWYHQVTYTVESESPMTLTIEEENGGKKVISAYNGTASYEYDTVDGNQNGYWAGYLTFIHNGSKNTAMFCGGTAFYYYSAKPAPDTAYFIYNDSNHPGKAVLYGVDDTMEYQLKGDTEWTKCSNGGIVVSLGQVVYIRYANYNKLKTVIKTKVPGDFPRDLSLHRYTGKIDGLTKDLEKRYNNGEWEPITDEIIENGVVSYMNQLSYGDSVRFDVRSKATVDKPASRSVGWNLYAFVKSPPSSPKYNELLVKIEGLNSTMEYSWNLKYWYDMGNYSRLDMYNTKHYGEESYIYVRTKKTDTEPASMYKKIVMPGLSRPAPSGIEIQYDSVSNEIQLSNLVAGQVYDYSFDKHFDSCWYFTAASTGKKIITNELSKTNDTLYLRLRRTDKIGPSERVALDISNTGIPVPPSDNQYSSINIGSDQVEYVGDDVQNVIGYEQLEENTKITE